MNKTFMTLGLAAIVLSGTTLISGEALAYRGDPSVKGPYYTEERHESMVKAFENKDYEAWKSLMQDRGRVSQVVNEQNFARFAEAHQLMLDGKTEEANKIKEELGLGLRNGSGRENGLRMGRGYSSNN